MPQFQYNAKDSYGQDRKGVIEAATSEGARQHLAAEGLIVHELVLLGEPAAAPPAKLSRKETEDVIVALAEVSNAELPLVEGLRAAAAESSSGRVARALRSIANEVEQGYAIESVMSERGDFLPAHVRGLVGAAARSRRLGLALDDLVEHHRASRDVWARVVGSIAYPLLVLGFTFFVLSFLPLFIVPQFKQMFEEFQLELPVLTMAVIRVSDAMFWVAAGPAKWVLSTALITFVVFIILASFGIGTAWSQRLASTMPLVGPIWQWSGAAAYLRLMATMIEHGVSLPDALRLASDGVRDPEIREVSHLLAYGVENGRSLSDLLLETNRLPMTLLPFVRWGEETGKMADGFRTASEMFVLRLQMRALLLRSISPPVVFIFVGILVGFVVLALFMPLVSLLVGLS